MRSGSLTSLRADEHAPHFELAERLGEVLLAVRLLAGTARECPDELIGTDPGVETHLVHDEVDRDEREVVQVEGVPPTKPAVALEIVERSRARESQGARRTVSFLSAPQGPTRRPA